MYLDVRNVDRKTQINILTDIVEQQNKVISSGKGTARVEKHRDNNLYLRAELKETRSKVLTMYVYGPTWQRIRKAYPAVDIFDTKNEALKNGLRKNNQILSNNGKALKVDQFAIVSFTKPYGGTKVRKIKKITDSGIYFEGVHFPVPITDTHRIYV